MFLLKNRTAGGFVLLPFDKFHSKVVRRLSGIVLADVVDGYFQGNYVGHQNKNG